MVHLIAHCINVKYVAAQNMTDTIAFQVLPPGLSRKWLLTRIDVLTGRTTFGKGQVRLYKEKLLCTLF